MVVVVVVASVSHHVTYVLVLALFPPSPLPVGVSISNSRKVRRIIYSFLGRTLEQNYVSLNNTGTSTKILGYNTARYQPSIFHTRPATFENTRPH